MKEPPKKVWAIVSRKLRRAQWILLIVFVNNSAIFAIGPHRRGNLVAYHAGIAGILPAPAG
jgi:hypothetical protein